MCTNYHVIIICGYVRQTRSCQVSACRLSCRQWTDDTRAAATCHDCLTNRKACSPSTPCSRGGGRRCRAPSTGSGRLAPGTSCRPDRGAPTVEARRSASGTASNIRSARRPRRSRRRPEWAAGSAGHSQGSSRELPGRDSNVRRS